MPLALSAHLAAVAAGCASANAAAASAVTFGPGAAETLQTDGRLVYATDSNQDLIFLMDASLSC